MTAGNSFQARFAGGLERSLLSILFLMVPGSSQAIDYSARAQVSGEVDNNIREDPHQGVADQAVRFFGAIRAEGGNSHNLMYQVTGNGGYRGYHTYSQENRSLGQFRSSLRRAWENGFEVEGGGAFYVENYNRPDRDNFTYLSYLTLTVPSSYSAMQRVTVSYQYLETRYPSPTLENLFDYHEHRLTAAGYQPLTHRLNLLLSVGVGLHLFNERPAVDRVNEDFKTQLFPPSLHQEDFFAEPEIRLQYYRHVLIEGSYMFREYRSNSYGFSYREHRFGMVIGSRFAFGSTIKFLANLEAKQYREKGSNLLIDLDEDREADNRGVVEISCKISNQAALELQYELYRNESRLRRLYYSKNVISLGLQYRLL